jgi:hypothetical protein
VAPTVPPRSLQEQSFFDPGTGAAAWECECRLSFRRVAAALTTRCAAADIPAACALVRSPIERRRAASASSRSCRAYAKRASDRCRSFAGDWSLPPSRGPEILGPNAHRRPAVTIRRLASSGVKGSLFTAGRPPSLRGDSRTFQRTVRTPAPVTRIGLQRTASPGARRRCALRRLRFAPPQRACASIQDFAAA